MRLKVLFVLVALCVALMATESFATVRDTCYAAPDTCYVCRWSKGHRNYRWVLSPVWTLASAILFESDALS